MHDFYHQPYYGAYAYCTTTSTTIYPKFPVPTVEAPVSSPDATSKPWEAAMTKKRMEAPPPKNPKPIPQKP